MNWRNLLLVASLALGACSDDTVAPPAATTSTISSGSNQTVLAGTAATAPLAIRVVDQNGAVMSGVSVTFAVAAGGGSLSSTSATTDAGGIASTLYTAGATAGTASVTASVTGVAPVTFSIVVSARTATTATLQSGSGQTAAAGTAATSPFIVKVVDQTGAPLAGTMVSFVVTSGGGTLSAASATTDASGLATVNYTAGATVGTSVVTATVAGLAPLTFSTSIGAANVVTIVSGNSQTGAPGAAFAAPYTIRVANAAGTALVGVPVTFAITSGGGTLSATAVTTGANGQAATTYTAGATAGPSTVTATVAFDPTR